MMKFSLISPEDFKVARVISFMDEFTECAGTVCYMRPRTIEYNKDTFDDFDRSIIVWLKSLNLKNVDFSHSENIIFDHQRPQLSKIYEGGRPSSKLSFTCHGNYTFEECITMEQINSILLELNVFWNTMSKKTPSTIGGVMTFDKNKEKYYFDVIKSITCI